tara:strand:- start:5 stop:661 length:657 start_codon:yes stop_codon:yes gene_type:complete
MIFIEGWYLPDGEKHFTHYLLEAKKSKFPMEYQKLQRDKSIAYVENFNTAIDIGACVGFWSKDLCKSFNKTICFEPYKKSSDCLVKNLEEYNNYELFNVALSNQSGKNELLVSEEGIGGNSLNGFGMKDYTSIEIETKKLDDYGFTDIDYIKIDVQFYELFVLQGAYKTLKNNNPLLCIECARRNKEELAYVKKINEFLKKLDYKIVGGVGKELFFKK